MGLAGITGDFSHYCILTLGCTPSLEVLENTGDRRLAGGTAHVAVPWPSLKGRYGVLMQLFWNLLHIDSF